MKVYISKVEDKSADWKVVGLLSEDKTAYEGVSVNRVNKKGETFPNFDDIKAQAEVEGDLWKSPADKWYLFAPKKPLDRPKFFKPGGGAAAIKKAQETKAENIAVAQERKHDAIARAGAFRDATLVTIASLKDTPFPTTEDFKAEWTRWVKFFLGKADEPFV